MDRSVGGRAVGVVARVEKNASDLGRGGSTRRSPHMLHFSAAIVALLSPIPDNGAITPSRAACGRRTLLAVAGVAAVQPHAALALFESEEQLALIGLATAQPKVRSVAAEVAEVKRKRVKMAADLEDDAYVIRFTKAVLDPAATGMAAAAPAIQSERAPALAAEFKEQVAALLAACRANDASAELDALTLADKSLSEFLQLAAARKFDVTPRDDINGYQGASGILYNKFLFRK